MINVFTHYKRESNMYFEELYVFCDSVISLLHRFLNMNHTLTKQLKHTIQVSQKAKGEMQTLMLRNTEQLEESSFIADYVSEFTKSMRQVLIDTLPAPLRHELPQIEELPDVQAKVMWMNYVVVTGR